MVTGLFTPVFFRPKQAENHRMVTIFPEKTVMACYYIDKQGIMVMKTEDLSDKRAFLSDNSKKNCVLLLCYLGVFITFATGYCFLRENSNDCLTKIILQILNDYFVCLVDS